MGSIDMPSKPAQGIVELTVSRNGTASGRWDLPGRHTPRQKHVPILEPKQAPDGHRILDDKLWPSSQKTSILSRCVLDPSDVHRPEVEEAWI